MKRNFKTIFGIIILIIIIAVGNYFLSSKFGGGECIQDARDGYTWHINRYNFGNYYVMGWQHPWWGLEVVMEKSTLERKDISGVPIYHSINCPDPSISG